MRCCRPSQVVSSNTSTTAGSSNGTVAATTNSSSSNGTVAATTNSSSSNGTVAATTSSSSSSAPGRSGPPGFDEQQVRPQREVAEQLAPLQLLRPLQLEGPPPGMSDAEWQDRMHVPIMSRRYGPAPHAAAAAAAAAAAEHPDTDDSSSSSSSSSTEHYSNDFETYTDGEVAPAGCFLAPAGPARATAAGIRGAGRTAAAATVTGSDAAAAARLPRLKQEAADKVALLERGQHMGVHSSSSSTEVESAAAVARRTSWTDDLD